MFVFYIYFINIHYYSCRMITSHKASFISIGLHEKTDNKSRRVIYD